MNHRTDVYINNENTRVRMYVCVSIITFLTHILYLSTKLRTHTVMCYIYEARQT